MTRLWPAGDPIAVVVNARAEPVSLIWRGRVHAVADIARSWRLDMDWWRGRVWRVYYKVSTDSGLLLILFQDLITGDWYVQRLYD